MIRRSASIAAVALAVSLLVHLSGLSWMSRSLPDETAGTDAADDGALSTAFEDLADALSEPVAPEPAPTPERPVAPPPDPADAVQPTSRALVASDNPQETFSPDTGSADIPQPDTTSPSTPDEIQGSGGSAETALVSPNAVENVADTPDPTTSAGPAPVEAALAEPAPSAGTSSVAKPATPNATASTAAPIQTSPVPSAAPIVQARPDTAPSPVQETTRASEIGDVDPAEADGDADGSVLAVAASPRPMPAARRDPAAATGSTGNQDATSQFDLSAASAAQRRRADQASLGFGGEITDGIALLQSRRSGNSDTTNFAGRVLVHLNRTPSTKVSARGTAQVVFEINADGTLAWVDVTVSSGSLALDSAAVKQVRDASPFPRPPQGSRRTFSFIYRGT